MTAKADVIRLHSGTMKSVLSQIQTFINNKAKKSENTASAYLSDIKQFFMFMCGKSLEELTDDDLIYSHSDVTEYQNYLADKYDKGSTVNRKIASVRSLMEFLARDNEKIRLEVYDLDRLHENIDKYGSLSVNEWLTMCQLVKKEIKGEEKSVLIELAGRTSIRLSALMSICANDIRRVEIKVSSNGVDDINYVYVVDVIDKGKKEDTKAIPDELVERMSKLTREDGRIFSLSRNTIHEMMDRLCKKMNIPAERNIVFHSFKKVAINDILYTTGNLMAAQLQGNHVSANTTLRHYAEIQKEKNLHAAPGLHLGKDIDMSVLDGMNAEQLVSVIRNLSRSAQAEIVKVAKNFRQ